MSFSGIVGVICPACGARAGEHLPIETRLVRSPFSGALARCAGCSLVQVTPVPESSELARAYEADYFDSYRVAGVGTEEASDAVPTHAMARLRRLTARVGAKRLLEVGVGHGRFMNYARSLGWDVQGLDISKAAAEQVKRRYGLDVHVGTIDDTELTPGSFDVVHMSHVLEHLSHPVSGLRKAQRLMSQDGCIVIEVPNEFENLSARIRRALRLTREYRVPSPHLFFFDSKTLCSTVRAAGLRVVSTRTHRDSDHARGVGWIVRRGVGLVENLLNRGPLIEVIAR